MKEPTLKARHILAALAASLIICTGVTLLFWLAEKKNAADSGYVTVQAERIEGNVD